MNWLLMRTVNLMVGILALGDRATTQNLSKHCNAPLYSVYNLVQKLREEELIEPYNSSAGGYNGNVFTLTPRGKEVAYLMHEIREKLK